MSILKILLDVESNRYLDRIGEVIIGVLSGPMGCATTHVKTSFEPHDPYESPKDVYICTSSDGKPYVCTENDVYDIDESKGELKLTKTCVPTDEMSKDECLGELNEFQLGMQDKMIDVNCSVKEIVYAADRHSEFLAICRGNPKSADAESIDLEDKGGEVELKKICDTSQKPKATCEEEVNSFQLKYAQEKLISPNCESITVVYAPSLTESFEVTCKGAPKKQKAVGE